jgi:hypothetical protein
MEEGDFLRGSFIAVAQEFLSYCPKGHLRRAALYAVQVSISHGLKWTIAKRMIAA